jgi:hypothetical protein
VVTLYQAEWCPRVDPWQFEAEHRCRFSDHRDARESDA